jgi:hypothetical protein
VRVDKLKGCGTDDVNESIAMVKLVSYVNERATLCLPLTL